MFKLKKQPRDDSEAEFDTTDITKVSRAPLIPVSAIVPNDWNPNVVGDDELEKLALNLQELIDEVGVEFVPPIVVRPHPKQKDKYQIVDGFHRWKTFQEIGQDKIPAHVVQVSAKRARLLTDQLNHGRGTNDPKKYAEYIRGLVEDYKLPLEYLGERLPKPADELELLLQSQNIELEDVRLSSDEDSDESSDEESNNILEDGVWVSLQFRVSAEQSAIVEAELARISSVLEGNNVRGRALEFMAVNSAHTPMSAITGENISKKKLKMKAKRE